MGIRIGHDDHGRDISLATSGRSRIAIVGRPGYGKTTICRFIVRRWVAGRYGRCAVITARTYEYAHLGPVRVHDGYDLSTTGSGGLLVVDDTHRLAQRILQWAVTSPYQLVVLTSRGASIAALGTATDPAIDVAYSLGHSHPLLKLPVRGSVDWPAVTVPLFWTEGRRALR